MTQDRADLGLPSRSHDADRYAFSPKVRRLKELLAKIEAGACQGGEAVPGAEAVGAAELRARVKAAAVGQAGERYVPSCC